MPRHERNGALRPAAEPTIPLFDDDLAEDTGYAAKLEADRLSAEFASPLNGGNLRRPLRAPRVEQGEMFRPAEGPRQEKLW